jgi:hypothetical protein
MPITLNPKHIEFLPMMNKATIKSFFDDFLPLMNKDHLLIDEQRSSFD